jgi:hypothetical protein
MNLSEGTVFQIIMYLITAAATAGTVLWRIKELEKKVEKHNGLVERMVVVEQSTKSAHHRIDEINGPAIDLRALMMGGKEK